MEELKASKNLGDRGLDGTIIFKSILKWTVCKHVDWINLAQARDQWQALVITVMGIQVHKMISWEIANFSRRNLLHEVSFSDISYLLFKQCMKPATWIVLSFQNDSLAVSDKSTGLIILKDSFLLYSLGVVFFFNKT